ncbi:sulfotransferase family protein [Maliponia aquimaris]|uniref:Sulfotransferase domain protein n=1 Tax=Maliponia aquimaris TaxID=1673631 RepID=A0A238KL42_9RHOB|nr:sulfotransferase [Maliponia aquimaris]SMX43511.1 hypothetical protein MAA8898_02844 [Maliponia aquimaris]
MPRNPILLVVGVQHSGTTILDAALGVSPQIVGVGEALRLTSGVKVGKLQGAKGRQRLCTCGAAAEACPLWSQLLDHLPEDGDVRRHFPRVDAAARALSPEARYVLDSSPDGWRHLDALRDYDVRLIQITRDVRSWVASRRKSEGDNLVSAHLTWLRGVRTLDAAVSRSGLPRFRLGYEELAMRPRETLGKLCDWIGVPFDPAMLTPFGKTRSHIVTGNSAIRRPHLAASIRYDGSWMADMDWPIASGLLYGACARTNRRLVYGNDVLKRRV